MSADANPASTPPSADDAPRVTPPVRPRRRWRRAVVFGAVGLGLLAVLMVGYFVYQGHVAEQALKDAIAEADRLDPGWRLEELEARRVMLPAEKNAATYVNKAGRAAFTTLNLGTNRADLTAIQEQLEKLPPHVRMTGDQAAALRAALKPLAGNLADARIVGDLPEGRYPVDWPKSIVMAIPHVDRANVVTRILSNEGRLHMYMGDTDKAWVCCRASFNVARSLGDEPITLSQLVRARIAMDAIRQFERTLAQGQVGDSNLADMQKLLLDEIQQPAVLITVRGERAFLDSIFSKVATGESSATELTYVARGNWGAPPGLRDEVSGYLSRHEFKPAHAWLLRYTTAAVEIIKKHGHDSEGPLKELEATLADAPTLARQLAPKFGRLASVKKSRALCACAYAAMAAERYRLQHKRWPALLAELAAARLLDELPTDPYDGKPLRLRGTQDGIVVYSVGTSGAYDGTALDAKVYRGDDERFEFRLWHAERR